MEFQQILKMKGPRSCKGVALIGSKLGVQKLYRFRKKSMCMVDVVLCFFLFFCFQNQFSKT